MKETSTHVPPPDYFCGHLIYEEDGTKDKCRFVVYDGDKKRRFLSRSKAEAWCHEHAAGIQDEDINMLHLAMMRLYAAANMLDKIAPRTGEDKERIEYIALTARLSADKIDIIITQHQEPCTK